jgi:predicted nuclease with TOPRIM domain
MKDDGTTDVIELLAARKRLKKEDRLRTSVSTKTLKVILGQDELLRAGEDLTRKLDEINALEDELKSSKTYFKAKLDEADAQLKQLQGKVRNKCEHRRVDCTEVMNNTDGEVMVVRMDTLEIIDERKMTADERQSKIIWPDED